MKNTITLTILVCFTLMLAACTPVPLEVKVDGQDKSFDPSSTWAYHSTKTFSYPENGTTVMTKSSNTTIVLANYDLDTEQAFISLNKQKIEKPEQVKVMFSLTGEKDTSVDTPIKAGDYAADAERFSKVDGVTVYYLADGKEKRVTFKNNDLKGKVNISGVSGGEISGEIDVTDGENTVKGNFTAKGHKSVK